MIIGPWFSYISDNRTLVFVRMVVIVDHGSRTVVLTGPLFSLYRTNGLLSVDTYIENRIEMGAKQTNQRLINQEGVVVPFTRNIHVYVTCVHARTHVSIIRDVEPTECL